MPAVKIKSLRKEYPATFAIIKAARIFEDVTNAISILILTLLISDIKKNSQNLLKGDLGENGAPGIVRPGKAGIPGRTCHPFVR